MASALRLRAAPSLALALLILLTVGIRTVPLIGSSPDADTGGRERIDRFFDGQGFAREAAPELVGAKVYRGSLGLCAVTIGEMHLLGWQNDIMQHVGSDGDIGFFIFDGATFAEPPVWIARFSFYIDRVQRVLGLDHHRPRMFGVQLSPGCAGHTLDWSPLQR